MEIAFYVIFLIIERADTFQAIILMIESRNSLQLASSIRHTEWLW